MTTPHESGLLGNLLDAVLERVIGTRSCPWHPALSENTCVRREGHRGLCLTPHHLIDVQTRKVKIRYRSWYGINYRPEGTQGPITMSELDDALEEQP